MQAQDHVSSTILLPGPNSFNKPKERSVMNDVMKNALIGTLVTIFCCANAYAGGTTGGGGNVALPDQVSDDALVNAVSISKNVVLAWAANSAIRYAETKRLNLCPEPEFQNDCRVFAKLFDATPTIFHVIDREQVETRMTGPCLDFNQQPNDGSMYGQKPGSVCISVSNIKQKLREDNYQNQVAALLLHETSHLLGTDEAEAVGLQMRMLGDFSITPFFTSRVDMELAGDALGKFRNLNLTWQGLNFNKLDGRCKDVGEVVGKMSDLERTLTDHDSFTYMSPAVWGKFWGIYVKSRAAWNYICSQDPSSSKNDRDMAGYMYNKEFNGKQQISANEYGGGFSEYATPSIMITKITDDRTFEAEAEEIFKGVVDISNWYSLTFLNMRYPTYQTQP